ncbi:LysM peptidoglycan-binding domain-containing protein [Dysgonomonas sp. 520]|uniref:LysM peptidoglycan-binding domain-containing protein n=1 Tax=Dysgonomonas sp. 520 TaxID=2302931 RepID=UPI0013D6AE62|nr:LysM peptidoglycan-binding domain-containing protein [Dysgonomonas sp. 520]NDW09452.1 LysM peptidoglycan-binding domain-containing protein [Dysgonomonas sp. 520]
MSLKDKYAKLIQYAQSSGVQNLAVTEQDNVLYVSGAAAASVKDQIWKIYDEIDPDMRAGDLVLKIDVVAGGEETYEVKAGDNLSKIAAKYPGMTWQKIFEANKDQLKNPDMIHPGQKLRIPL